MNLEFAALQENIDQCKAAIAASEALRDQMADCLSERQAIKRLSEQTGVSERAIKLFSDIAREFEITKGCETTHRHTEPNAPSWPLRVATDGEKANGRLAWVPGAK